MSQLDDAFRQISDELRTQYLLAYYPSQRLSNSEFRRIQVGVTGPAGAAGFHVRNRAGYYTTKSDFEGAVVSGWWSVASESISVGGWATGRNGIVIMVGRLGVPSSRGKSL